jgi:hypothetical protein
MIKHGESGTGPDLLDDIEDPITLPREKKKVTEKKKRRKVNQADL